MPRYYFDVKNGHRLIDPAGVDCRNDAAAATQGKVVADQIASDVPSSRGRQVEVLTEEREKVATVAVEKTEGRK